MPQNDTHTDPTSDFPKAVEPFDLLGRAQRWLGWPRPKTEPDPSWRDWRDYRDLKKINEALLPILALALAAIVLLGFFGLKTFPTLLLWSMACLSAGGLLGFVFGIPRAMTPAERAAPKDNAATPSVASTSNGKGQSWRANTNLEEVSDWLTKIIVGLSLVHLADIEARLRSLSKLVAASISQTEVVSVAVGPAVAAKAAASAASAAQGAASAASTASGITSAATAVNAAASGAVSAAASVAQPASSAASSAAAVCASACSPSDAAVSVAMALIICMTVVGFLLGYLYTRLFLPGAFGRSENAVDQFKVLLRDAQASALQSAQPSEGQPVVVSTKDIAAAQSVALAVPVGQPDVALQELLKLCAQYDRVRVEMPVFSRSRTRRMTDIATQMRPLTVAARGALDTLANSAFAGERLAATVMLSMQFDSNYIDWLAERLTQESAFIGFHAASALLARMPVADAAERQRIATAVQAAKARIELDPAKAEKSRDALIDRILEKDPGPEASPRPPSLAD